MTEPRMERRLSAIMVADIVGYSRLVEADESGTLSVVRALRAEAMEPCIADHKGRVVKLMGDGVLAEFGSVVDAVACAVAFQTAVAARQREVPSASRIVFRIGINLGDVVVEGDDLMGDAVNVAQRLEQLCEPGRVLISGTAYDHLQGKLGLPLDFIGEQHVKNINRPVRAYAVRLDGTRAARRRIILLRPAPLAAAAGIVAFVALAGLWGYWQLPAANIETSKPSIAVLPFANLGGDAVTGRLADGVTEDIITDLSRFRDFDIIARNSVEGYKNKPVDVREVASDLDVRYVLEGSIQRQAERVRVTVQLIDATSGAHLWSERWDRPVEDVFAVQSEVSENVASIVAGSDLLMPEMQAVAKRKRPQDLEAYDLTVLAYEALLRGTEADTERGIAHADAAIARDPDFARAYVQKAWLLQSLADYRQNWNESYAAMEPLGRTAIRLDPYDANAHILLAWALAALGKNAEALAETNRALELNPSSADVLNIAAESMSFLGKPDAGAELCDRSFRLNPSPPDWYYADCVTNFYYAGRYQEAIDAVNRGAADAVPNPSMLIWKAASEAELGHADRAAATARELAERYPAVSLEWQLNNGWNFERDAERDRIVASAKKAGVRICAEATELGDVATPHRLKECAPPLPG